MGAGEQTEAPLDAPRKPHWSSWFRKWSPGGPRGFPSHSACGVVPSPAPAVSSITELVSLGIRKEACLSISGSTCKGHVRLQFPQLETNYGIK